MVCLNQRDELPTTKSSSMAVSPDRTPTITTTSAAAAKPLHNFDLPWLRWGSQRHLRCLSAAAPTRRRSAANLRRSAEEEDNDDEEAGGIAAVSRKLLGDLKMEAAEIQVRFFGDDETAAATTAIETPWNLRTRRAAAAATAGEGNKVVSRSSSVVCSSPEVKRAKFTVGLSKKEIESDFMLLLGQKPARRPKKRPKPVQNQINCLLPGFLLGEVTEDLYKVENPETGKR